jgi:uncharacterized RDD family membrane protein YckC
MTTQRWRLARLPRRAAAYLLDCGLLAAGVVATQLAARLALGARFPALNTGPQVEAWILLSVSLPVWGYWAGFERSAWQATPAKRLLGLRVISAEGGRPSTRQALLRTAVKLLPWELTHATLLLPVPIWSDPAAGFRWGLAAVYGLLGLSALAAILTPRRQAAHDLAAGTVVEQTGRAVSAAHEGEMMRSRLR